MKAKCILDTFHREGRWAGFIVYKAIKYVTVKYYTCVIGSYDLVFRLTIEEFENLRGEDLEDKCYYLAKWSGIQPIKKVRME